MRSDIKGKEEYLYSAFIQCLVSKCSDMDHTELAWLVDLQWTAYPQVVTVSYRSSAGGRKNAGQRLTFYHWATQVNKIWQISDMTRIIQWITQSYLPPNTSHTCLYSQPQSITAFGWYSLHLPMEGWPGWVDLGGWLDWDKFPTPGVEPRYGHPSQY